MSRQKGGMLMIKRLLLLLPVFWLCYGCSDDDCPTCVDAQEIVFMCTASYRAELGWNGSSILSISAAFVGDPVPHVSLFSWLGQDVPIGEDGGVPYFEDQIENRFEKLIDVAMVVEHDTVSFLMTIPDSTQISVPAGSVPSNEPVEISWTRSADAERYSLAVYIIRDQPPDFELEFDTVFTTTDTTITLDAYHLLPGRQLNLQIRALIGRGASPGNETNFRSGELRGFVGSQFIGRDLRVLIN